MIGPETYIINESATIKQSLDQLQRNAHVSVINTLFVVDTDNRLVGAVTDGDVRRALINDMGIDATISSIMNNTPKFLSHSEYTSEEVDALKTKQIFIVPVIDKERKIVKVLDLQRVKGVLRIDAVIMAGGKGERLMPLTKDIPKPLLKVGEKPIIEINIDRLNKFGVHNLYLSVNYKGELIEDYFEDGSEKGMQIKYVREKTRLGTMGAVGLVDTYEHDDILVMNSDLLTDLDFQDFYNEFKKGDYDMIVATIPYKVNIPYAVLETNKGKVTAFKEKPTYTYYSNAGIYLFKRSVVDLIPSGQHYDATDLMQKLIDSGKAVGHYGIVGYWLDIGQHDEYEKANVDIKYLKDLL